VFGFDGRARSGTISYYNKDLEAQTKYYAAGCMIFMDGSLKGGAAAEEIWHSAAPLQGRGKTYYSQLFKAFPGVDEYYRSQ
jgi:hypothetical protein